MSCACLLGSHVNCVQLPGLVSDAHHAVAVTLTVAVAVAVILADAAVPRKACLQRGSLLVSILLLLSLFEVHCTAASTLPLCMVV